MTRKTRALLREVLALPSEERAGVAAELLESLAPPTRKITKREWLDEIERRARRVLKDPSKGETWKQVRERTARKLAEL